jgi:hypothetical protein
MARLFTLAKGTVAFLIVAVGVSVIIGSLMGGGFSRLNEYASLNDDPRSVLVHAVLVDGDAVGGTAGGVTLDAAAFRALMERAGTMESGVMVRSPAMLVQHGETGTVQVTDGVKTFAAGFSPHVIKTRTGPVIRLAVEIKQAETGEAARALEFATAYTAKPGATVVLDLAGMGADGNGLRLALRTELMDPAPEN